MAGTVHAGGGGSMSVLGTQEGQQLLYGWGKATFSLAKVQEVGSASMVGQIVGQTPSRGVLARGLGRSYGDAGMIAGGTALDLSRMNHIIVDEEAQTVTAGAGASFDALLRALVPLGWFVPVTAGTRMITVGGAIAADVHGKNHHLEGSFGNHVRSLSLVDGTGTLRQLDASSEEFWATIGGMGLTGVIVEATFGMLRIGSSLVKVDTDRVPDLDDLMERMRQEDSYWRYSVAWVDSTHRKGRGIWTRGDHAEAADLPKEAKPFEYDPKTPVTMPDIWPNKLVNQWSMKAFNEAWWLKAPRQAQGQLQSIAEFFHPLDGVKDWNRAYGKSGFLQYQYTIPDQSSELVGKTLRRLQEIEAASPVTVLKRFGPANSGFLSFPQAGWTLAIDLPTTIGGLGEVLDELDELVLNAGGRLYLAKDSRMSRNMFEASYPRLEQWKSIRNRMDPQQVFTSDLARRLQL